MGIIVWILGLSCAVAVGPQAVAAYEDLPIVIRSQRTVVGEINTNPNTLDDPPESCDARGITCDGCTNIKICNHDKEVVGSYQCSSIDAKKPYCKDGVCSSDIPEKCIKRSELCPEKAKFYPVPGNCSETVYCDESLHAQPVSAPSSSYVFNFTKGSWSPKKTAADCFQINCQASAMQNKFYAYKPNPQLYFYCASSGPLTFVCDKNDAFNEAKRTCEFACKQEGNFPLFGGKGDQYNSCLLNADGSYQLYVLTCPKGLIFDEKEKSCMPLPPPKN